MRSRLRPSFRRSAGVGPRAGVRRRERDRGQSLTEFALVLPVMLAILGGTLDFARLYQGWITLQGATRSAAEFAAEDAADVTAALTAARRIVCAEARSLPGYVGSGTSCSSPTVEIVSFTRDTRMAGATTTHPIVTVTVRSTLPFRMLFDYPGLRNGTWALTATETYEVAQNR